MSYDPWPKPTEEDVIKNSKLEHLYNHDFGGGRFFQVVFADDDQVHVRTASRTMFKVVYVREKDDIEGFEIVKLVSGEEKERVKLSKFNFAQLRCFLDFINGIDLKGISSRRILLADDSYSLTDFDTRRKMATLLSSESGGELIAEFLSQGVITGQDLVNTGYRRAQLGVFNRLLREDGYLSAYKVEIGAQDTQDEKAWQYFFERNEWIFGYGLDYRFQGILQREFSASNSTAAGKQTVISDYLLGDKRFTTFVEIKLPTTKLFGSSQNRSRSWRLSSVLVDAYSQILEQKASGQLKVETTKELLDEFNNDIEHHAYDSRTILVVGSWVELEGLTQGERSIKERTFELFRRDSRNVDIITYDELYERASYIVENASEKRG